jgi:hypothetical protein
MEFREQLWNQIKSVRHTPQPRNADEDYSPFPTTVVSQFEDTLRPVLLDDKVSPSKKSSLQGTWTENGRTVRTTLVARDSIDLAG